MFPAILWIHYYDQYYSSTLGMPRIGRPQPLEKAESIYCPHVHLKELKKHIYCSYGCTLMSIKSISYIYSSKYYFKELWACLSVTATTWKKKKDLSIDSNDRFYIKLFLHYWSFKNPGLWLLEAKIRHA